MSNHRQTLVKNHHQEEKDAGEGEDTSSEDSSEAGMVEGQSFGSTPAEVVMPVPNQGYHEYCGEQGDQH